MITVIQSTGKQTGSSVSSITLTLNGVAQGNTIIVLVAEYRSAGLNVTHTVSDAEGVYSRDVVMVGGTSVGGDGPMCAGVHRMAGVNSGTHSITVSASTGTSNLTAIAFEVHSSFTANRIYKEWDRRATGSSTSPSTGATPATSQAASFSVAIVQAAAAQGSITVSTSPVNWAQLIEELTIASAATMEADTFTGAASGTVSASWTLATSAEWIALVCTFGEVL